MCILSEGLHTLPKVFGYYDLSVLSMSVMGFQKKFGWGWVGGVSSIQFFFFFNFARPLIWTGLLTLPELRQITALYFESMTTFPLQLLPTVKLDIASHLASSHYRFRQNDT